MTPRPPSLPRALPRRRAGTPPRHPTELYRRRALRARLQRLLRAVARSLVPTAASLGLHALLLALLLAVTVGVRAPAPVERPPLLEVQIDPAPAPPASPALANPLAQKSAATSLFEAQSARATPPPTAAEASRAAVEAAQARSAQAADAPALRLAAAAPTAALPLPPRRADRPGALLGRAPSNAAVAASFAGLRARAAERVVYVVDASGAMASSLTLVLEELARSIDRLRPTQRFAVLLLGEADPASPTGLRTDPAFREALAQGDLPRATPEARQAALRWLGTITASGRSDPLAGLRAAIDLRPDLVFLFSRSIQRSGPAATWGAGKEATLNELNRLNPLDPRAGLRPVTIKSIQFLDEDPTGLMQAIGLQHGDGDTSFRLLTLADLGRDDAPAPDPHAGPNAGPNAGPDALATDAAAPHASATDPAAAQAHTALIDRAAAALADPAAEAATLAVLYGLPDAAQRATARRLATEVLSLLEPLPPASPGMADPRGPILRARAAAVLAHASTDPGARLDLGLRAAAETAALRSLEPAADALARLATASGLTAAGRTAEALEAAESLLADADDLALPDALRAEALLARLLAAARVAPAAVPGAGPGAARAAAEASAALRAAALADLASPPFALTPSTADVFWTVLAAQALVRAEADASSRGEAGDAPPPINPARLAALFDPLLALAADTPLGRRLADDPAEREALVLARVDAAVATLGVDASHPDLPVAVVFAVGASAAADPARRDEAIAVLSLVANRPAAGDLAWRALLIAAEVVGPPASAALHERVAAEHPGSPHAEAALAAAVAALPAEDPQRPALLARALALRPAHPAADAWRVELAARSADPSAALALLDAVATPALRPAADELEAALTDRLLAAAGDAERPALLRRAAAVGERLGRGSAAARQVELAEATLDADPRHALHIAETLGWRAADIEGGRDRLALLRARALLALGDADAAAFATLKELTSHLRPEDAAAAPQIYWPAHTLLLELLAQHGGEAQAGLLRGHLARLAAIDPALGGEPWAARLRALRAESPAPPR